MNYHILRELADSWGLLALFALFLGAVLYALRPSARASHRDAADLPFRHEDAPAADPAVPELKAGCARACPDCRCATRTLFPEITP